MTLGQEFIQACLTPSDINEHLPKLYDLAKTCNSVTEFGVRDGVSTRAFLFAGVKLRSYDLYLDPKVSALFAEVAKDGIDVSYLQGNTLEIDIEPTDLLFIDSKHTYTQLKAELARHSNKVRRFIVLHDMESFGRIGEDGSSPGLVQSVEEFIGRSKGWKIKEKFSNNNGLWVIESHV